jgi:hypothetical protein
MSETVTELTRLQWHTIAISAGKKIFPELYQDHECGWFDGGCYSFASGFKNAVGDKGVLSYIGRSKSSLDHAIVFVPEIDCYLDADGAHTKQEMFEKLKLLESKPMEGIWEVGKFPAEAIFPAMEKDVENSVRLALTANSKLNHEKEIDNGDLDDSFQEVENRASGCDF